MNVSIPRIRFSIPAPAALVLGILAGVLPATAGGGFLPWGPFVAVTAAAAALLLLERRFAAVAIAGIGLGLASIAFHTLWDRRTDACEMLLPPRSCGGDAELRIADPRISSVPGITPPTLIRAEIRKLRLTGETDFRRASGILYLKLPAEAPPAVRCGDLVTATGTFVLPGPGGALKHGSAERLEAMRDFSGYLAGRGASRTFRAREAAVSGRDAGLSGFLAGVRDRLLERAVSQIESPHVRNLTAALFFGTSGGVSPENRLTLIESGTIHLFSVSGMHVAMLAAVLLWLLRPLPLRSRYLVLAGLVLLYVLSTGANAPAMRAFYMIGLWCVLRAALLYMPPLHALLLAGGALIVVSPALLLDMGFQYSFVITAILILAGERFEGATELLGEEFRYMPNSRLKRKREKRLRRGWMLLFAVGACGAAFLGGVGISLYSQGMLLPGSVPANLALMPVVALLFPILFFKLGFGLFWSGFDRFGAWLLERCFGFMEAVTQLAATGFGRISAVRPSPVEILLFYAALFLLATVRKAGAARAAALVLVLLPAGWILRAGLNPPALFVAAGSTDSPPVVAFHDPGIGYACAVNASEYAAVSAAADFLQKRGVTRIEQLAFSEARTGSLAALPQLASRIPVAAVTAPELDRYSRAFFGKLAETLPGCPVTAPNSGKNYNPLKINQEKEGTALEYSEIGSNLYWCLSFERTDSGWHLKLLRPNSPAIEVFLPNSSVPEVWEHEFR